MIHLTAIVLTPGGSSTVHIYTKQHIEQQGRVRGYTLAYVLQLRKKHGKTSVRVVRECQLARWKQNIHNRAYITIRIHKHNNKNT